jgi:putative peptidoglycan lipid II flippase
MFGSAKALLFGGLTGKVLGVLREVVFAALLGTGMFATAFRLSQTAFFIPIQGLLSDALTSGFTPQYARDRGEHIGRARVLFAAMHLTLLIFSLVVGGLLAVFASRWVHLLAPGFDSSTAKTATGMVQCLAFSMPLYALTSLYAAAQLAGGRAAMSAARATAQSIGIIGGVTLAWFFGQPLLIPIGFVLAYFILAVWGLRAARVEGLPLWPATGEWHDARKGLRSIWIAYKFLVWIPALMQVHFVVERRIASVVNVHAVAALDYARFVSDTAVLLLAMPFGLAGLATMAGASEDRFRSGAHMASRLLLYLGVPLSIGLFLNARWVVQVAYGRGAFGPESITVTATILQGQSIGLWAQLVGYSGTRFLSARGKNRSVVIIYALAVVTNILMNVTLAPVIGVEALGIASSANNIIIGATVLYRLGIVRHLSHDLRLLICFTGGYVALWAAVPDILSGLIWLPPLLFGLYWGALGLLVPHNRKVFLESWRLLRAA